MENTLLGRCVAAYDDAADDRDDAIGFADRQCMAAVLEHLAAELLVMHQNNPRLTVFELATILRAQSHP